MDEQKTRIKEGRVEEKPEFYEYCKIVFEKSLLGAVLIGTAYFAQHYIKKLETHRIAVEKFQEKRIEVATELAIHCSALKVYKIAFDEAIICFNEYIQDIESLSEESIPGALVYIEEIENTFLLFRKVLSEYESDAYRQIILAKLFLGQEISNDYRDFFLILYSENYLSDYSKYLEKISTIPMTNTNIQKIKHVVVNFMVKLRSDESMVDKYQSLIRKLDDIIHSDL